MAKIVPEDFSQIKKMEEKEKRQLGSEFEKFCITTSAHGFTYLTTSSKSVRFCWVMILILAFGFGVFHLFTLISEYLKYDYHESIVINSDSVPVFPDVSVCDSTGTADSSMARYNGIMPFAARLLNFYKRLFTDIQMDEEKITHILHRVRDITSLVYSNLGRNEVSSVGARFDGLIVHCTYKGVNCTQENFKHYLNPSLINCYTFHVNESASTETNTPLVGPQNGLSLILRSEPNANIVYADLDTTGNEQT